MKRIVLCVFTVLVVMLCATAHADTLTLPSSLTVIEEEAFFADTSLDRVVLGENVREIGPRAFAQSSLNEINLPKNLKTIDASAFEGIDTLTVHADKGTYAYQWAVNQGYIRTEGLEYKLSQDGSYAIITGYTGSETHIVIPQYIDGYKVNSIGDHAFEREILPPDIYEDFFGDISMQTLYRLYNDPEGYMWEYDDPEFAEEFERIHDRDIQDLYMNIEMYFDMTGGGPIFSVELPDSLYSIGNYAFSGCEWMSGELKLPNDLRSIGNSAFEECKSLSGHLNIPSSVWYIGDSAFSGCQGFTGDLILPNELTVVHSHAFSVCTGLNGRLFIPDGVKNIERYAFFDTSFSGVLHIPKGVKRIEEYAFAWNSGFTGDLIVPEGVEYIGQRAFIGCRGFKGNLVLPDTLKTIYIYAFNECTGLTGDLIIPDSVTQLDIDAFRDCTGFNGELVLPNNLQTLEFRVFANCSGLTGTPVLPQALTTIEKWAFLNCSGLTGTLYIPSNVSTIKEEAFLGSGFDGVVLPDNVSSIEKNAFLDTMTIYANANTTTAKALKAAGYDRFRPISEWPESEIVDADTVIKSISTASFAESGSSVYNIFFDAFDGDNADYKLYYSSKKDGRFTLESPAFGNLFDCKLLTSMAHGGDEKVYYRIYGPTKSTSAFSPDDFTETFRYKVLSGGNARLTGWYTTDIHTSVIVPEEIDGYTVTEIASDAFQPFSRLEVIYLPDRLMSYAEKIVKPNSDTKILSLNEFFVDERLSDNIAAKEIVKSIEVRRFTENNVFTVILKQPTDSASVKYSYEIWISNVIDGEYEMFSDEYSELGFGPYFMFPAPRYKADEEDVPNEDVFFRIKINAEYADHNSTYLTEPVSAFDQTFNDVKYRALLIGLDDYTQYNEYLGSRGKLKKELSQNHIAQNDLTIIKAVLQNVDEQYTIRTCVDCTKQTIESEIDYLQGIADENDISLIYVISHGDSTLSDIWAGSIAIPRVESTSGNEEDIIDDFTLTLGRLANKLNAVPGKKILLMGQCGSGAALEGVPFNSTESPFKNEDYIVMTAAKYLEEAYNHMTGFAQWLLGDNQNCSYFAEAFGAGIGFEGEMPADTNSDGEVTVNEMYAFISKYLKKSTPQYWSVDPENDILFTRKS